MPPRKQHPVTSLISQSEWDRICEVYRRHNGPRKSVAEELGWTIVRMKRVFKRGYPSQGFPPVMQVLCMDPDSVDEIRAKRQQLQKELPPSEPIESVEEVEAKAVVIHTREQERIASLMRREDERRHAREDALEARTEEAVLVSSARRNAIALNGVTAQLMAGAIKLAAKIQKGLEEEASGGTMSTKEQLALVRSAASVARFSSETTMLAAKTERMVLGEPIETEPEHHDDGSLEQAVAWIERSVRAVERARKRGLLTAETLPKETH